MATSYTSNKKIGALDSASTPLAATNEIVINQNGDILKTPLSAVEAKVFDAKTQTTTPTGTEVTIVRQTDGTLRQVPLANIVPALNITNAQISNSAAIEDTKLATINTAGKVTNNAVQAVSTNTANRIVTRDGSGNFAAGTITATLSGNASTATFASSVADGSISTAKIADGAVTSAKIADGTIVDTDINASAAIADTKLATISTTGKVSNSATTATNANTANAIVARDGSGNFSAGTVTASLTGNVTGNVTGNAGTVTNGLYTNAVQTVTGQKSFNAGNSGMASSSSGLNTLEVYGSGGAAMMTFHRPGQYAVYFGLDSDNVLKVGGWSMGNVAYRVVTANDTNLLVPVGAVMPFAMNSAPSGWLAANGSAVSRSTYAALFAAIGVTHGAGDSVTTFNLPDLRGIFVRGSGSQTISGTTYSGTFAAKQQDDFKSHTHKTGGNIAGASLSAGSALSTLPGFNTSQFTEATGGTETRPANIALLYCIKF